MTFQITLFAENPITESVRFPLFPFRLSSAQKRKALSVFVSPLFPSISPFSETRLLFAKEEERKTFPKEKRKGLLLVPDPSPFFLSLFRKGKAKATTPPLPPIEETFPPFFLFLAGPSFFRSFVGNGPVYLRIASFATPQKRKGEGEKPKAWNEGGL